ncbi:HNH endonuclease [Halomonas janggokensis]|uniref:HNH endonuclease n=1 Tax=Vreelandella janggokensis TaxID=370767 RepID=A0ABT4IR09_9GAMM|nr:HNH endonuclease [Halomonas janggokensis]MCZ0926114.1 HNH endonuclease [Halomonas janggokensis]MCZ0931181.1 HNH endonuclease [Halomonas janggokensis]
MRSNLVSQCLLCEKVISTEIDSREHLIPNSIGGRKKVSGFLCVDCNSKSGDNWESALARQMNPLSLFFRINRERGDAPSQKFKTSSGGELVLNADGSLDLPRPIFNEQKNENGVEINISARNMAEAKRMLKGVARKYPQLDVDELLEKAQAKSSYSQDPIKFNLSFGGLDAGRSFIKTALALLSTTGVSVRHCEHAIEFLKEEESEPCFGYYYEKDLVLGRPAGVPVHIVHVNGDPDSNLIRGYVEYFGIMRVVMCLSSSYSGSAFSATYSIDPTKGEELGLDVGLDLTLTDIRKAYDYEKWDGNAVQQAMGAVIGPTLEIQYKEERERVLEEAVRFAFANCGAKEGEIITEEQYDRLVGLLWEKLEPWVLNQLIDEQRHY